MFRAPTGARIPGAASMIDAIPANRAQIARHLGVTPATVDRWHRTNSAPIAVLLALFWETPAGRQTADFEAARWASLQTVRCSTLERELGRLAGVIDRLELELTRMDQPRRAANLPVWRVA